MKKWAEMEPRERDATVAERVMGWKNIKVHPDPKYAAAGLCGLRPAPGGVESGVAPVPNYSTDIAAAWDVVERMQSLGFRVEIVTYEEYGLHVQIKHFDSRDERRGSTESDSAPFGICKAALEALSVEGLE